MNQMYSACLGPSDSHIRCCTVSLLLSNPPTHPLKSTHLSTYPPPTIIIYPPTRRPALHLPAVGAVHERPRQADGAAGGAPRTHYPLPTTMYTYPPSCVHLDVSLMCLCSECAGVGARSGQGGHFPRDVRAALRDDWVLYVRADTRIHGHADKRTDGEGYAEERQLAPNDLPMLPSLSAPPASNSHPNPKPKTGTTPRTRTSPTRAAVRR